MKKAKRISYLMLTISLGMIASLATVAGMNENDVKPLQYCFGVATTFVKKSNGESVGSTTHEVLGTESGTDSYYDPSTWGEYVGGGSISCAQVCSCYGSGSCSVDALNTRTSVEPYDWSGYDTCNYWGGCSNGIIYGTVTASCSTIYGCYIDVEWHAMCHSG